MTFVAIMLQNGKLVSKPIQREENETNVELRDRALRLFGTPEIMLVQKAVPTKKKLAFFRWIWESKS